MSPADKTFKLQPFPLQSELDPAEEVPVSIKLQNRTTSLSLTHGNSRDETSSAELVPFHLLMDFGHRLEIRAFFRSKRVRIDRIRRFKNHYRVYYFKDGRTLSAKWPKDVEGWLLQQPK